jgi:hypothetical protein
VLVRDESAAGKPPERAFLKLQGFVSDTWAAADSKVPPASQRVSVEKFVTRLPFVIGRSLGGGVSAAAAAAGGAVADELSAFEEETGVSVPRRDDDHWLVVNNSKISKVHAVIYCRAGESRLRLYVVGRNGVDFNGQHLLPKDEVELVSRAPLRIGPIYCFPLLPLEVAPGAAGAGAGGPASAGGTGAAPGAGRPKSKPLVAYKTVVNESFGRHFVTIGGFFTVSRTLGRRRDARAPFHAPLTSRSPRAPRVRPSRSCTT